MRIDNRPGRKPTEGIRPFLTLAGFHYWTASLLPALVGTALLFWLRSLGFSFRLFAAVEILIVAASSLFPQLSIEYFS